MTGDNEIKKLLRAADGLSTEATGAGIIDLPIAATMTAHWEVTLTNISEKEVVTKT